MILVGGAHPVKCLWNLPVSSDKEKEELVAYLDGELPDEAASRVEKSPAEKTPSNYSQRAIAWGIRAAAFVGLLFVATSGFNGAFKQNSEPIDQLLTELPVIQRLDEYQEIRDVEFLKSLNESGLFDERDKAPQD